MPGLMVYPDVAETALKAVSRETHPVLTDHHAFDLVVGLIGDVQSVPRGEKEENPWGNCREYTLQSTIRKMLKVLQHAGSVLQRITDAPYCLRGVCRSCRAPVVRLKLKLGYQARQRAVAYQFFLMKRVMVQWIRASLLMRSSRISTKWCIR